MDSQAKGVIDSKGGYRWAARGDINAFFGLMLDNIGCMILMASLLVIGFDLPRSFVLVKMIPGTAVGVLVGDLIYTVMALRLARRTGRMDVTAMPLGLDTPSTFGTVFLIIGPAYKEALARGLDPEASARHAWFLGIAMILASGIFKLGCAPASEWVRRVVPRAGLLGSLTAIALVIISFLPLLDIVAEPVAGMVALALILATLTARWHFPRQFPARSVRSRLAVCAITACTRWDWDQGSVQSKAVPRSCFVRSCRCRSGNGSSGSRSIGGTPSVICRWPCRSPWRPSSGGSTAPRARRPPATITRRVALSPPRAWRPCWAASSAA